MIHIRTGTQNSFPPALGWLLAPPLAHIPCSLESGVCASLLAEVPKPAYSGKSDISHIQQKGPPSVQAFEDGPYLR